MSRLKIQTLRFSKQILIAEREFGVQAMPLTTLSTNEYTKIYNNKYLVKYTIGRGSFGTVFKVVDILTGAYQLVRFILLLLILTAFLKFKLYFQSALKEIISDTSHKKDINTLNEIIILRGIDHDHVIKCLDCFINDELGFYSNCIVSEFCEVHILIY